MRAGHARDWLIWYRIAAMGRSNIAGKAGSHVRAGHARDWLIWYRIAAMGRSNIAGKAGSHKTQ